MHIQLSPTNAIHLAIKTSRGYETACGEEFGFAFEIDAQTTCGRCKVILQRQASRKWLATEGYDLKGA